MSNPVPIYSQVLPKSQQQRAYKQTSPSLQSSSQPSRVFSSLRYDPRTPQPGIFDPGFDPLNHNHGGNFGQFNVTQNPEAYFRVEKFARESARRSARESGSSRMEGGSRMSGGRRERQISHVRQAEHRINLRSLSLNETPVSRVSAYNDRTPTEHVSHLRDNIQDIGLCKENSKDLAQFPGSYKETRGSFSNRDNTKDLFIPGREFREMPCHDMLRNRSSKNNRDSMKDCAAGRDVIYENDGGIRGYNIQSDAVVPEGGAKVFSVKRSSSSHKVCNGNTSSTVSEKRKFYCREWAFQKIAHCLEQRPVSKTCGALVLGDAGSGKTALCRELSQPGSGPAARQQRALQRRMLARHFLQGQNENSLTMGEFIRTLVMQILNHSTQHRHSLIKSTPKESAVKEKAISGIIMEEVDEKQTEKCAGNDLDNQISIMPSAPPLDQLESENQVEKNNNEEQLNHRLHRTMERIHENDQYNDLLLEREKISMPDEKSVKQLPARIINTNPFLPNFGQQDDREHKLYENHENLFLRNISQSSKEVKSSRLHRQQSEPPFSDKRSAVLQKSLSTDSKNVNILRLEGNQDNGDVSNMDKTFMDAKCNFRDYKSDASEVKDSKDKGLVNSDCKNRDQSEIKELKLPLSPSSNVSSGKVSRIPVASFKYPNMSGLSSTENSPSKISTRSLRDGQRSSASDNSDNKEPNPKSLNNDRKLSTGSINEDKKNDLTKEFKALNELPEYQNILKPPSCPKKLSPKMSRPSDYCAGNMNIGENILNSPDYDPRINDSKLLAFHDDALKSFEQRHADASLTKLVDTVNEDVPPPIPSLPVNPRTLIANCYYEKLLSEPEIQQALLPHNLEKNPDECFKKALLFPLLEIDPPKQCLFLLVDSIDESPLIGHCANSTLTKERDKSSLDSSHHSSRNLNSSKTIAELLANHHHLFPQWLLLVCTARKQSKYLTKMFTGFRKISLDDLRKNHVTLDVQRYILARLDSEPRLRQHVSRDAAQALDHLRIKSNGCFLYLERVLDGLADGSVALREIREIPGTLNGLYLWLCQRLFHGRKFTKVQPLLNILLAAKCGVDVEMLFRCLLTTNYTITREDFNKRLHLLKRILTLDTTSGVLSIFHHSFSEWLLDVKHCTRRFLCNAITGHAALAMYYTLHAPRLAPVEIHSLVLHMTRLEQHHNSLRNSKSNIDSNLDQNIDKPIPTSTTYSNLNVETGDDPNALDFHSLVLLWILDSGCRIETSLRRQVDNIEKELGSLSLMNSNRNVLETITLENKIKSPTTYIPEDNTNYNNFDSSLGVVSNTAATAIQEIPEFLTNFYCPTLPRDTKVLRTLLEMGAQVELWPQNTSLVSEEQPLKKDDAETDKTEGDTSFDIRASQISLEHLLMLDADEAIEGAECFQEESIALFDIDPLTGRAPIHLLAQNGDAHSMKNALEGYESTGGSMDLLELMDRAGQTSLQLAARGGRRAVVALLLAKGARADRADSEGWTPLRAAAWGGHTEVVELLLNHGCEVDCVDSDHRTALRAAAWSGHEEIVRLLLAHGADVNKTDLEGRTALIAAAYMGHTEIVNHLLDHGADIDHADSDGRTALAVAALCSAGGGASRGGCVQLLLERGAAPARPDKDGMTPLLVAAFEGHKEVIELLLEADADPEVADKAGRTPLWAAATAGHASAVRALLFWGCCVDTIDQDGRTVLSVAAAQGSFEVVRQLVDRGLDEHHRDNAGWTPLHYAAFEGHLEVCEVLLEAGAKVDETDNDGKGPLMLAAQEGHCRLLEFLIDEWAAPVDQHAHDGKTALRVASLEGHYEAVRTLIERGADVDALDADQRSTLYILALDNRVSMAHFLIQKAGADVETRDSEGRTPLHVSAWQGHYEMVNLLLTGGSSCIDARDAERRTPLHSASWRGQAAVVRLLLSKGADPNAQCDQGATPLGIASQEGHEECVLWLLQHGANPKHSDHCGRTPAKVALRAGHLHVCRLLERWGAAPPHQSLQPDISTNTSGSTAETKACSVSLINARLSPLPIAGSIQAKDCSPDSKRRSVHSSNSTKSSSNLTSSTVSSHQEVMPPAPPPHARLPCPPEPVKDANLPVNRGNLALSFAQQVVRCGRRTGRDQSGHVPGVVSPLYATPPHSPLSDICSPTQPQQPGPASGFDRHFCRDTHMRIILGRENKHASPTIAERERQQTSIVALGNTAGAARLSCRKLVGSIGKIARRKKTTSPIVSGKTKRNGIVTNPAMRLVANVRNGLDTAAANLRRTGVALAASASSNNPAVKTNAFQWKRETPL